MAISSVMDGYKVSRFPLGRGAIATRAWKAADTATVVDR